MVEFIFYYTEKDLKNPLEKLDSLNYQKLFVIQSDTLESCPRIGEEITYSNKMLNGHYIVLHVEKVYTDIYDYRTDSDHTQCLRVYIYLMSKNVIINKQNNKDSEIRL